MSDLLTQLVWQPFVVRWHDAAVQYLNGLPEAGQLKVLASIEEASRMENRKLFKPLRDGVWEFRVQDMGDHYRFFGFWLFEEGEGMPTVVITQGWRKTQKKIPSELIEGVIATMNS